jgi:hypothetical protein
MAKYLLQLEDRGEFVSSHDTLGLAQAAATEQGFDVKWQDHPRGEEAPFAKVFKDAKQMHPVAVAYPSNERTLWIWRDPTA